MIWTYEEVRIRAVGEPRVHGNGFVQVDMDRPGMRLNVWGHPDIPRQRVSTAIHDHRFGFVSTILRGQALNIRYNAVVPGDGWCGYDVYQPRERQGEDTELVKISTGVDLIAAQADFLTAQGSPRSYAVEPKEVHEVIPLRPSATMMTKTVVTNDYVPRVFVPHGQKPDNDFDRNAHDVDTLWRIIQEVMEEM